MSFQSLQSTIGHDAYPEGLCENRSVIIIPYVTIQSIRRSDWRKSTRLFRENLEYMERTEKYR